jgi:hypothetical protein
MVAELPVGKMMRRWIDQGICDHRALAAGGVDLNGIGWELFITALRLKIKQPVLYSGGIKHLLKFIKIINIRRF